MRGFCRPIRVRSSYVRARAHLFLREMNVQAPPVYAKQLLKNHCRLFFYNNALTDESCQENGFSCLVGGAYRVYINTDLPAGRDTFTYAHELAHIVLKHHEEFDTLYLTDHEHWLLDREADIFAASILMPEEWVKSYIQSPVTVQEIGRIKDLFGVSWEAVINRLDELKIHTRAKTKQLFTTWHNRNNRSLGLVSYKNAAAYRLEVNFCTQQKGAMVLLAESLETPDVDQNRRYVKCPNCGNMDFSHDAGFCKKCGQYLYNGCTNFEHDPRAVYICGRNNVSDALYCEYCGSKTMLLELMEKFGVTADKLIATSKELDSEAIEFTEDDIPF